MDALENFHSDGTFSLGTASLSFSAPFSSSFLALHLAPPLSSSFQSPSSSIFSSFLSIDPLLALPRPSSPLHFLTLALFAPDAPLFSAPFGQIGPNGGPSIRSCLAIRRVFHSVWLIRPNKIAFVQSNKTEQTFVGLCLTERKIDARRGGAGSVLENEKERGLKGGIGRGPVLKSWGMLGKKEETEAVPKRRGVEKEEEDEKERKGDEDAGEGKGDMAAPKRKGGGRKENRVEEGCGEERRG